MKNYNKLKEIIQKSNPEIMELKFGCEVYSDVWEKVKVIKEKGSDRNEIFFECCNRDGSGACFIPEINLFDNILGRPIRLADVLLAVINVVDRTIIRSKRNDKYVEITLKILSKWDLEDNNLDNQSDDTKQFLIDLLI